MNRVDNKVAIVTGAAGGIGSATCRLLATVGNPVVHPAIQPIIKLHDEWTRCDSKLPFEKPQVLVTLLLQ
jgi:NADP-dependent 3-hydroxy acid dehydrogenase YdfG